MAGLPRAGGHGGVVGGGLMCLAPFAIGLGTAAHRARVLPSLC